MIAKINKIDFDFFFANGGFASSTVKADTILYEGELLSLTKGFAANNNWSNLRINYLYLVKSNIKISK